MTKKEKNRYYPLRDPENPHKVTLVPITEAQYRALYPEIWRICKREQNHGCCICPKRYLWKCDGQCDLCEYHTSETVFLDEPLPDGDGSIKDYISNDSHSIEELVADRLLLEQLFTRLRELDPDADRIIEMLSYEKSDRAIAEQLGRKQRTFADQMKRYRTELRKIRGY